MQFITRQQMGWPATASRLQPEPPRGTKVHYEGDEVPDMAHSRCVGHWTDIRNMHLANKEEGYSDVAYNLAVCQHGYILEGRGAGHQTGANGNQSLNRAHYAVVVLIGGDTEPSAAAVEALKEAILYLRQRGAGNEIKGHRDGYATSCPGGPLYDLVRSGSLEPSQEDDMPSPQDLWSYTMVLPDGRKQSARDIITYSDERHNIIARELDQVKAQLAEVLRILAQKA